MYWTKYYGEIKRIHPDSEEDTETAVAGRLKFYTESLFDSKLNKITRVFMGNVISTAKKGDETELRELVESAPPGVDIDECAEVIVERDLEAIELLLNIKYDLEDLEEEDERRKEWNNEQLSDVRSTVMNRR